MVEEATKSNKIKLSLWSAAQESIVMIRIYESALAESADKAVHKAPH